MLYNILKDPAETNNLALTHPAVTTKLRKKVEAWLKELPKSIPEYE